MSQGSLIKAKDEGMGWNRQSMTNCGTTTFSGIVNTTTAPALGTNLVLVTTGKGEDLAFSLFGTGADGATFDVQVVGWSSITGGSGTVLWKPTPLFTGTCTLSTSVGVADANQTATERDVDTIVASAPTLPTTLYIAYSPTSNVPGMLVVPSLNFQKIAVYFTLGTATGANALWKWLGI